MDIWCEFDERKAAIHSFILYLLRYSCCSICLHSILCYKTSLLHISIKTGTSVTQQGVTFTLIVCYPSQAYSCCCLESGLQKIALVLKLAVGEANSIKCQNSLWPCCSWDVEGGWWGFQSELI